MRLYDKLISQALQLIASAEGGQMVRGECRGEACRDSGEFDLVLKSDMAYELGGGNLPAVSGLF